MRLSGRTLLFVGGVVALLVLATSDQVVPATSPYQAQMRIWLVARATGLTAYLVLTVVVVLGLILSHPVNQSTWRLSKRLFPWHENLFVFVVAFVAVHIASLVVDPYAGVGLGGAFLPGASSYRSVPVALGTLALYAFLIAALTARYTRLLPAGAWLRIHRFSLAVFALAWAHGVLAGTDTDALRLFYAATGATVLLAAAYRYWVGRQRRPTFSTSLPEAGSGPVRTDAATARGTGDGAVRAGPLRAAPADRGPVARARPSVSERETATSALDAAAPLPAGAGLGSEVPSPSAAAGSGLMPIPGIHAVLRRARRTGDGVWSASVPLALSSPRPAASAVSPPVPGSTVPTPATAPDAPTIGQAAPDLARRTPP